ncbi:MAG: hypothetical protein V1734_00325 [Nanoarchaeota archaeon]
MNKTLVGLVAAAGMLGCARDVPVYSPQAEVVQEVQGFGVVYKAVWSNAEQLKLSLYVELTDGSRSLDLSWSRYEAKDATDCLNEQITLDARVDMPEYGFAGRVNMNASDRLCNGSVEACSGTYTDDNGQVEDITADICADADEAVASLKETLDTQVYNINEQVNAWHNRKGL